MREVEVKYRVVDLSALEAALLRLGVTIGPAVMQDDHAYAPTWWDYEQCKIGVPFARLRTENGRHTFTVKKPLTNAQSCVEHESEVIDRDQMHAAVIAMGFRPTVRIVKRRRTGELGAWSLCLDEVERAGCFLELECLPGPDQDAELVQAELAEFVDSLGVGVERVSDTYDSLVRAADLARA